MSEVWKFFMKVGEEWGDVATNIVELLCPQTLLIQLPISKASAGRFKNADS